MPQNKPLPSPQATQGQPSPTSETTIGAGVSIKGDIIGRSRMELQGTVEGNVILDGTFVVAHGGKVIGDITATSVIVDGEIKGNVHASDRVQLSANSKMLGNLLADKITIHEGALFQGRVDELPAAGKLSERRLDSKVQLREPVYQ